MTDLFSKKVRSRMMSAVKGKDTKPELTIRKTLFALGFRYRVHDKTLPGKPDLVFSRYKAVLFIHGCFWHRHHCKHGQMPRSNTEFWEDKIGKNAERDRKHIALLQKLGWRVRVIWTCSLKNRYAPEGTNVIGDIVHWLLNLSK